MEEVAELLAAQAQAKGIELAVHVPRLLLAEDNPINQAVMVEMLHELGCDVDVVENGRLALEAISKGDYPLVLMDCQMPELDGYEATRLLRASKGVKAQLPIIAVTAHAVCGERERALAAGMNDYIAKPVTPAALAQALSKWLPAEDAEETPRHGSRAPAIPSTCQLRAGRRSATVIQLFLRFVPKQIEAIAAAVGARDAHATRASAHKLKGSCMAIGAMTMARACASLELLPDNAPQLLARLADEFQRVKVELTEEFRNSPTERPETLTKAPIVK